MNAKEAFEIIREFDGLSNDATFNIKNSVRYGCARAYIEALRGPEVMALVEALKKIEKTASLTSFAPISVGISQIGFAKEALATFNMATGKE